MARIRRLSVAIILFVIFTIMCFELFKYVINSTKEHPGTTLDFNQFNSEQEAESHTIYKGERLFVNYVAKKGKVPNNENGCGHWIIFSAQHIPTKAVGAFKYLVEKKDTDWCCVAILHNKLIEAEYELLRSANFIVLTQEKQEIFFKSNMENIPATYIYNFRKNIGYIYAIIHGAKAIYDTNEDSRLDHPSIPTFDEIEDYVLVSSDKHFIPSYQNFISLAPTRLWIRGFYTPSSNRVDGYHYLKEKEFNCANFDRENVKIIKLIKKSISIHEMKEMATTKLHLALHKGTFAVYDSTSILYDYKGFFAIFQRERHQERITDIVRNLFTQRLLCDIGFNIGFVEGPINPANYTQIGDRNVKTYHKIVKFLLSWESDAPTLVERMEQLAIKFNEKGYWALEELLNVQTWLVSLIEAGYNFPIISEEHQCSHTISSEIKDCLSQTKQETSILDTKGGKSGKLDLYLRMSTIQVHAGPTLEAFYDKIFAWTAKFFWQENNPMSLILVLDDEKEKDHKFGLRKMKEYPYPTVYYEIDKECYGPDPKNRMQWSMHWADNYTTRDYIGFIDSDSWFNTLVNEEMFFDGDKPHAYGFYGESLDVWSGEVKLSTYEFLKIKQVFRAMNYFPVIIKTKHLIELRKYIENIHGATFDEVFLTIANHSNIAQFHIMMNYVWYFHRDEYVWHMEESQVVTDWDKDTELIEFPEITNEMKKPFPKFILHYKAIRKSVNVADDWDCWRLDEASLKTRNKLMLEGYCFSGGFILTPDLCAESDEDGIRVTFFDFEHHSWLWDDRCLAAQREHYSRTSGLEHNWDLPMLNDYSYDSF